MLAFILSILGVVTTIITETSPSWLPEEFRTLGYWPSLIIFAILGVLSILQWIKSGQFKRQSETIREYEKQVLQHSKTLGEMKREIIEGKDQIAKLEQSKNSLKDSISKLENENNELLTKFKISEEKQKVAQHQLDQLEANDSDSDILMLLGSLQKQGRFLDFIKGDISQYPDAQVGAAARVVHRGCQSAINEFLDLEPIHQDKEGETVDLEASSQDILYSFSGDVSSEQPKNGKLLHKGWRTKKIQLPKRTTPLNPDQLVISPAEIEL